VKPPDAVAVEDAVAGVGAGRTGGFRGVVGVGHGGNIRLDEVGADVEVEDLKEIGVR
jgi:beta-phosphoglucomutase-like phosphatase (HAD superfamily)